MSSEAASISPRPQPLFGLAASFRTPEAILAAAQRLAGAGYLKVEAFTPMPVEGLAPALGFPRTRIALAVLIGAIVGGSSGFFMQWFANVVHYPWNIGGRPPNSWPMFIPITFELSILFAALSGILTLLIASRLPQWYHPLFRLDEFTRASQDRFFICVEAGDPRFEIESTRVFLAALEPEAIWEVPR